MSITSMSADLEKGSPDIHDDHPSRARQFGNGRNALTKSPRVPIANPGPLGLFSFASTAFILSMYNASVRDIHTPNVVVGMAIFCGGLAQLLAGQWEFPSGNTFGAAVFTIYGAFWMSYGTVLIPGSGILAAYAGSDQELANALGIYLMAWFIVTFLFLIVCLRKSIAFIVIFVLLDVVFLLLAVAELTGSVAVTKAGGIFGVLLAFSAYYVGLSVLLDLETKAVMSLPLGVFKHD